MRKFFQRSGAALAALIGATMSLQALAANGQLPPERQAGVASYLSGGIGEGESQRFEAAFNRYPLIVQLFEATGARDEYTADAHVKITDAKGHTVLDERADGPFMLVRLPAGDYRVGASLKGRVLAEHQVHVTHSGHAKASFVFPANAG
ncbi:MAG: carboxypeptidase regulatory-like domain-containing protein [Burkholderiales bacterium]